MKPSPLAQSRFLAKLLGLSLIAVMIGCAGGAPPTFVGDDDGNPPPQIKLPPSPKDGSSTAPNCEGVPESGACQDGVAVYCDVEADQLRRKDCKALGKSCVVDAQRGALCEAVDAPTGGGPSSCDTGVTFEGSCGGPGGQTATWCDPTSNSTIVWDCAGDGMSCETDTCGFGAYCCPATPPPVTNECPALGFYGECDGDTAKWCNGDTLVTKTCGTGKSCQLDKCATGAFCCDDEPPPVDECTQIGFRGVCTADGPRWCSNGTVQQVSCPAGKSCQLDVCGDGAYCCDDI